MAAFLLSKECFLALNSIQANWHPLPLLQDTIDTLVQASSLPLSILIVGIGESPELSKMEVRVLCVYRICTARVLPIQLWRQLLLHARFSLQCFSSRSCSC